MMQGAWAAKRFVTTYLEADLPDRMLAYRNHLNLPESRLRIPTVYHEYEPPSLLSQTTGFPVCYTIITTTTSMIRVDYEHNLDPHYRVTYQARTYVWDLQDSASNVTESRDHMMLVLRSAMLDHQCLKAADPHDREVRVDEGSFQEEYSDIEGSKMGKWRAGAYLGYNITLNEILTRKPIGTVDDIRIETSILPAYLQEGT